MPVRALATKSQFERFQGVIHTIHSSLSYSDVYNNPPIRFLKVHQVDVFVLTGHHPNHEVLVWIGVETTNLLYAGRKRNAQANTPQQVQKRQAEEAARNDRHCWQARNAEFI